MSIIRSTAIASLCLAVLVSVSEYANAGVVLADSSLDFSGEQGRYGWSYGYSVAPFTSDTFTEFPNFSGSQWYIRKGVGGYWTMLAKNTGHPNGVNGNMGRLPVEQHAVRRWTSSTTGVIDITATIGSSLGCMNTYINVGGDCIFTHKADYADETFTFTTPVYGGSRIDFVISTDDNQRDVSGLTKFKARIEQNSPPIQFPNPRGYLREHFERAEGEGRLEEVDGNMFPDAKVNAINDDAGNVLELWAMNDRPLIPGWRQFAYRFVPVSGETPVWIGSCNYPIGRNHFWYRGSDTNNNGKPDVFSMISMENWRDADSSGTDGDRYDYDPDTNVLIRRSRGESHWGDTTEVFTEAPTSCAALRPFKLGSELFGIRVESSDLAGVALDLTPTEDKIFMPSFLVEFVARNSESWTYSICSDLLDGVQIQPGDTWTIAGNGLSGAHVDGDALLEENGGWQVSEWMDDYAIFEATTAATITGDEVVGFHLQSDSAIGEVPWMLSRLEDGSYSGATYGAVPEPSILAILAMAAIGLLAWGWRRQLG